MRNKSILYLLSLLLTLTFFGCVSDAEEEFMIIAEKIAASPDGGSGSGSCPVGKWGTTTCNGGGTLIYYFGSNGEGYAENPDCNGICTPLRFHFRYTVSGNTISYTYTKTDDVICSGKNQGRPNVPSGNYSITFTCQNGGSQMLTEVTTNGVRRTTLFDRM